MTLAVSGDFTPPRSLLLVAPAGKTAFDAAAAAGADALIVDCASYNDAALRRTIAAVGQDRMAACFVRLGPLSDRHTEAALDTLMPIRPRGIVLAGAGGGADVTRLAALLRPHEARAGIPDGATRILAMASDTPASLLAAASYAGASRRLAGLIWGTETLARALTATDSEALAGHARATVLLAAAAASVAAIDRRHRGYDLKVLEQEAHAARAAGFVGKLAVRPDQVPVINAVFSRPAAPSS
jgi:citrate lyase subunit beta/citryl-CoA lyase